MKKICTALVVLALAAIPLVSTAAPAMAASHHPFVVVVNGTADVTRQPLTVHQVVYSGGIAYTVQVVRGVEVVFTPRLSGPDRTVLFST